MLKRILHTQLLLLFCSLLGYGQISFNNPGLEGTPSPGAAPPGWGIMSSPDIQPGEYCVDTPPAEGNSYSGFCKGEGIQQTLSTPLVMGKTYRFTCKLANSFKHGFVGSCGVPGVRGGSAKLNVLCSTGVGPDLVYESTVISHQDWQEYLVEFVALKNYTSIIFTVDVGDNNDGNVLIDDIQSLPSIDPKANFGYDSRCEDQPIQFTNFSVGGATSTIVSYQWTFGHAGATSTDENPTYTYPSGNYWVKLVVTDSEGKKDSISKGIAVRHMDAEALPTSGTICKGDSFMLRVVGAEFHNWSPANEVSNPNISRPKVAPTVTTTYLDVASNKYGCIDSIYVTVSVNQPPEISISAPSGACEGSKVDVSATGAATYTWYHPNGTVASSNGSFSIEPFAASDTGSYKVVFTGHFGCKDSAYHHIALATRPTISVTGVDTVCEGENVNITFVASGASTYQWEKEDGTMLSTGATFTLGSATLSDSGVYRVIGEAGAGCFDTAYHELVVNPMPTVTVTGDDPVCVGDSVTLTATGGGTYEWRDGTGTLVCSVDMWTFIPGPNAVYTVDVTDSNGCVNSIYGYVPIIYPPTITFTGNTTACLGDNIAVTASGAASYEWESPTGAIVSTSSVLSIGSLSYSDTGLYRITAIGSNGCIGEDSVRIGVYAGPQQVTVSTTPSGCGSPSGSLTVTNVVGGVPAYQYALNSGSYQSGNVFSGIGAGSHVLHVQDNNGCTYDTTLTVGSSSGPTAFQTPLKHSRCGLQEGQIIISNVIGGATPYTYSIDGSAYSTGDTFTGLPAGDYVVYVKDANDCVISKAVTINSTGAITNFSMQSTGETCDGDNGELRFVSATGGEAPYEWSRDGVNFQPTDFTDLDSGSYSITVRDDNGCLFTLPFTVGYTPVLDSIAYTVFPDTCGKGHGEIHITQEYGGVGTKEYYLNGVLQSSSSPFTGLGNGNYPIALIDHTGCMFNTSIEVGEIEGVNGVTLIVVSSDCGVDNGEIHLKGGGGTAPYQYSFDGGAFTSDTAYTGLFAGDYAFSIRDSYGCEFHSNTPVRDKDGPIGADIQTTPDYCDSANASLMVVSVTGGASPYEFAFSGGTFTSANSTSGLAVQSGFEVSIRDDAGCRYDTLVEIVGYPAIESVVFGLIADTCSRGTGEVSVTEVLGGTAGFTYSLNGSAHSGNQNYSNLSYGTAYSLNVKDNIGCELDTVVSIPQVNGINGFTYAATPVLCNVSGGEIQIRELQNALYPVAYSMNGEASQTDSNYYDLHAITYSVTVTDIGGCTHTENITVDSISGPNNPDVLVGSAHCGQADGSVQIIRETVTTGVPPYAFHTAVGDTSNNSRIDSLYSNTYTLITQDDNGCTVQQTLTVPDVPGPQSADVSIEANTCNSSNGSVTIENVVGGSPNYEYALNGGTFQSSNRFTNLGDGNYSVQVRDHFGCVLSQPLPANVPAVTGPDGITVEVIPSTCELPNGAIHVASVSNGTAPYTYSCDTFVVVNQSVQGLYAGIYPISITDATGCVYEEQVDVPTGYPPIADFTWDNTEMEAPVGIQFRNLSSNAYHYQWFLNDSLFSNKEHAYQLFDDSLTVVIQLVAYTSVDCADTIVKYLRITPSTAIYVPNSFTPDGDGFNDFFGAVVNPAMVAQFQLSIYDRWGEAIFRSENPQEMWNGLYNGVLVPSGIYPWRITYKLHGEAVTKELMGHVNVLR